MLKKPLHSDFYLGNIKTTLVLKQFNMTMVSYDIAKNIMFILFLFQSFLVLAKMFAKIPKLEKMYLFSYINTGHTGTYQVSAKNYNLWSRY